MGRMKLILCQNATWMTCVTHSSQLELFPLLKTHDPGIHTLCVYLLAFWSSSLPPKHPLALFTAVLGFPSAEFQRLAHSFLTPVPKAREPHDQAYHSEDPIWGPIFRSTRSHHCNTWQRQRKEERLVWLTAESAATPITSISHFIRASWWCESFSCAVL